ncbi:hypothetical protein LBMAG53_36160 [Planctomycetota bacterium]|nr:hypothetical protein LBMAG53_36160 [Planctomycetota bacterium]
MPTPELAANALPISPGGFLARFWLILIVVASVPVLALVWYRDAFLDRGYAPQQPIAFSHALHAGKLKLDCTYCHFNATKGKHAGIPAMSACLGCHLSGGIGQGKPEVAKLLELASKPEYDDQGIAKVGGVVHWNRVHKLPDHVYFTHQAHVAAGVSCETCHGPVKEMTVMRQFADLSMGWCLECHRRSNYVSDPTKDEGFAVGTASYPMQVGRQVPDPVVVFTPRKVNGAAPEPAHATEIHAIHGDAAPVGHGDAALVSHGSSVPAANAHEEYTRRLSKLMAAYPELPRWKTANLPASHRAYLETIGGKSGKPIDEVELLRTYMNAPTTCSTCHQ